jgi:hypothetical protein
VFHGDYRLLFAAPVAYEGITAEDVRALAASVLRTSNRTVGLLESPGNGATPPDDATPQDGAAVPESQP